MQKKADAEENKEKQMKNKLTKVFALLFAAAMVLALTGCPDGIKDAAGTYTTQTSLKQILADGELKGIDLAKLTWNEGTVTVDWFNRSPDDFATKYPKYLQIEENLKVSSFMTEVGVFSHENGSVAWPNTFPVLLINEKSSIFFARAEAEGEYYYLLFSK